MQQLVGPGTFMKLWICIAACLALSPALAAPPSTFEITYSARYDSFEAEASRYLRYDAETSLYQLQTAISLILLGHTVTSLVETSEVRWEDDQPVPLRYQYRQTGLNTRSRSIEFDQKANTANFTIEDKKGTVALNVPVYDDLSSYLAIREQLEAGAKDIKFEVLDKDTIKTYHYQVEEEAVLTTALGKFQAIKLIRIRDDNPTRTTEIWVAKDYDYILLKFIQEEPSNSTIRLDITKAVFNDAVLKPD